MRKKHFALLLMLCAVLMLLSSCASKSNVFEASCANARQHRPSNYGKTKIAPASTTPVRGNYNPH